MADPVASLDDDPDLKALAAGLQTPAPDAGASSLDNDPDLKAIQAGFDKPAQATPAIKPRATHSAQPTKFHQAAQPIPANEPEPSWGDTSKETLKNLGPSVLGVGKSMLDAVTHPVQTLQGIGQLGAGVASQAAGAVGFPQDQAKKAKTEQLAKSLEDHYAQQYGSVKGFKKAIATDPASVLTDASMVLDPAAGVLGKLGEAGKLGALSGAAKTAAKVLPYANPIKSAVAIARVPGKALSAVGRGIGSVTSGVPETALKIATEAGASGDPAVQAAFSRFATGQADAGELADRAHAALAQVRNEASQKYLAGKAPLLNKPVDMTNTYAALNKADAEVSKGSPHGFQDAKDRLAQMRQFVDSVANNPDPAARNIDNVDALKQQIYDLHSPNKADKAGMVTNNVYHGIKSDLVAADPEYAKLMENYASGLRNTADLTKTLGLKQGAAASATLAKNLKALKTGTGTNLLGQLIAKDPSIGGMLAGAAVNPWSQHNSIWEAALGAGLPSVLLHPIGAAAAIPGAAAGFALSSPRVVGSVANLAGKASKPLVFAGRPLGQGIAKGAYYAGRANQENAPPAEPVAQASPDDIDKLTRMVIAEAGNQPTEGKAAVVHTAINRAKQSGQNLSAVVDKPYAFEGVDNGNADKIDPDSEQYKETRDKIVLPALEGKISDPTGGMVHFLNKDLQSSLGRKMPAWARGEGLKIGAHTFYPGDTVATNDSRGHFADGGAVDSDVEKLVARLMSMAKQAKKTEDESTKTILKAPDNVVVKALAVAQRAI